MGNEIADIKESFERLCKRGSSAEAAVAKVLGTDGATCKAERVSDGMVIPSVRLNAISTEGKGVVVVPKTGTYILISRIGQEGDWFMAQCGEAEKVTVDTDTEIVINGGQNGGLVKIEDLVGTLQHMVDVFNTHTHTVPDGTSSTPGVPMGPVQRDGMENTSVKH